jgi:hypothetical protein
MPMKNRILSGALLLWSSSAQARAPLPDSQWNSQTHVWLARAMVAEAGWLAERDHVAIAYVLARRWRNMSERWPTTRFIDVVRRYCAGLGDYHSSFTRRQLWIRALSPDIAEPEGWPAQVSWRRHSMLWRDALVRSAEWAGGILRDPCRGRAEHWGGTIDSPRGRMVPVDCGETENTFYRLKADLSVSL